MEDKLKEGLGVLTRESTNEEIKHVAFEFVHDLGYMIFSTIGLDGEPAARGIEVHYLDDTETLYIGMSPGKPMYYEMVRHPYVAAVGTSLTVGRLSGSVRLFAELEDVDPDKNPEIYARYWELNPGTKALYRKALYHFRIFRLKSGTGRVFHMGGDDIVENSRFTWGGATLKPWAYEIDEDKCLGCGTCETLCMEDVIHPTGDGKYRIDHFNCLECGICADNCPGDAVICSGRG